MFLRFALLSFCSSLALAAAPTSHRTSHQESSPVPPPPVEVPIHPNSTCPIMGKPISTRLFVDTELGRFWVCCKACYVDIEADVRLAHQTAYPVVQRLELQTCPVTGEVLPEEPTTVILQGFEIPVCCPPCAAELRRESQRYLALLGNAELEDLANPLCPVSGEAVVANAYCTIGTVLVRLSSPLHLEAVQQDPTAVLAKARAIVAEHGAVPRPTCPERVAREAREAEAGDGQ
jgi:hypothetical protein